MMQIEPLSLPGCLRLHPKIVQDARGIFVKPFVEQEYLQQGLHTDFVEEYYSRSRQGVLRGMHFQRPPHEFYKMVSCLDGHIRDVILDLRVGSPAFGRCELIELKASDEISLYLPPGIAHGFLVLSGSALVFYKVTCRYVAEDDAGVLWSSLPLDWGIDTPLVSDRDASFPALADFVSPFTFEAGQVQL